MDTEEKEQAVSKIDWKEREETQSNGSESKTFGSTGMLEEDF